jgi:hypothetical protein
MNKDMIEKRLYQFIRAQTGITELHPDMELMRDLKLDGDDAQEFMSEFSRWFSVDLGNFHYERHFGPEAGFNPFSSLYRLLLKSGKGRLEPLTIADLLRAATHGKWIYITG